VLSMPWLDSLDGGSAELLGQRVQGGAASVNVGGGRCSPAVSPAVCRCPFLDKSRLVSTLTLHCPIMSPLSNVNKGDISFLVENKRSTMNNLLGENRFHVKLSRWYFT
jgi:hypothetical protein